MPETILSEKEELKELLSSIRKNNQIRIPIFIAFLILSLLLIWGKIDIPWATVWVILTILILTVFYNYYFKKIGPNQTVNKVSREYLITQIIEVVLFLVVLHFWGAIVFGGIAVFMVYVMFGYFAFTRRIYPRIIVLTSAIGYIIVASLEHFGIISARDMYGLGVNPIQIPASFYSNITFMVGLLICLAIYGDIFSKKLRDSISSLRKRTEQLTQREKELGKARSVLEIEVRERTKELEQEKASLEERVKERTKQLQERVGGLERFWKLTVGRELKMVELKKEVERLKKESKTKKS